MGSFDVSYLEKLSSNNIIPAASLATSVPAIPMAKPTSAFLRAGASFVPSPVTATTSPNYLSPVTNVNLSSGLDLAKTCRLSATFLKFARFPISTFFSPVSISLESFSLISIRPPTLIYIYYCIKR